MGLSSSEYIKHVVRWLLNSLKKSIKCAVGKHMRLVNNVNTLFKHSGSVHYTVTEVTNVVNTCVGGCVHFYYVCGSTGINGQAVFTFVTWVAVNGIKTVYNLGKNLCAGSFTCTS